MSYGVNVPGLKALFFRKLMLFLQEVFLLLLNVSLLELQFRPLFLLEIRALKFLFDFLKANRLQTWRAHNRSVRKAIPIREGEGG